MGPARDRWLGALCFQLPAQSIMLSIIESKIVRAIEESVKRNWQTEGPANWTRVIKRSLVNLGHKLNYKVFAASAKNLNSDSGEWLFDLCWLQKNSHYTKLGLAAEIEWKNESAEILRDFKKLTVAIAKLRLLVITYNENNPAQLKRIIKLCKNASPHIQRTHYLLVAIPAYDSKKVLVDSWKF